MNVRAILLAQISAYKAAPFEWGANDCAHFVADCAVALGKADPLEGLRGHYQTEVGAKRLMAANGWQSLADFAAARYREIPVSMARSGDWGFVVNDDETETLGVVVASQIAAQTLNGVGSVSLTKARRAFRVE